MTWLLNIVQTTIDNAQFFKLFLLRMVINGLVGSSTVKSTLWTCQKVKDKWIWQCLQYFSYRGSKTNSKERVYLCEVSEVARSYVAQGQDLSNLSVLSPPCMRKISCEEKTHLESEVEIILPSLEAGGWQILLTLNLSGSGDCQGRRNRLVSPENRYQTNIPQIF